MTNTKKKAATKGKVKSSKPDKSLFSGFSDAKTPVQKVVPVNENESENPKDLTMMSLQVTKEQKRTFDIYSAMTGLSLKQLLTRGANEFMKNHPAS